VAIQRFSLLDCYCRRIIGNRCRIRGKTIGCLFIATTQTLTINKIIILAEFGNVVVANTINNIKNSCITLDRRDKMK